MSTERKIPVMELFGPTVQGEGMVVGRKTMFVRTAGCDYSCSWCDSAFTWDGSGKGDIRMMAAGEIAEELWQIGDGAFDHVTISGGNPALLSQLKPLVLELHERNIQVALETQGSRWQDWFLLIDELTLSPKPPSSGMKTDWAALDHIVNSLQSSKRHFSLKAVVFDLLDLEYATFVHLRYPDVPMYIQAGNDRLQEQDSSILLPHLVRRYEWLIAQVMPRDELKRVHVLPQLHTWVWGNKKGV